MAKIKYKKQSQQPLKKQRFFENKSLLAFAKGKRHQRWF
jgi:hypothetical protein